MHTFLAVTVILGATILPALGASSDFGPNNPFYAPSTLPYHAPPFDKIKDSDYQPAIEAGMAEQLKEVEVIANNPAAPTFENTIVAMEKSGQLLNRATETFFNVVGANSDPKLLEIRSAVAPKLAAHQDAITLNPKLFARVAAIYQQRKSLNLDPEALRLVEWDYNQFVHAGANLSEADKTELKKLNQQIATLSDEFETKLLAATKAGAYVTKDKASLSGLTDAQVGAAMEAAKGRKVEGYVVPLQNTTQQPDLGALKDRATRETIFTNSWNRTEHGDANDTRATIAKIAQLRKNYAIAGRLEFFNDANGLMTGTAQTVKEFTITGEYKITGWLMTRAEFRTDWSDHGFFEQKNAPAGSKMQPTALLGLIAYIAPKK